MDDFSWNAARMVRAGLSGVALVALVGGAALAPAAHAQGHEDGGGHSGGCGGGHDGGGGGCGGGPGGDGGHEDGGHEDGDHEDGGGGSGGAGHGGGGQGKGQGAGKAGAGGRPVWAREGIPEVELGRLNVVRSPPHVLDRAYAEALAGFTPAMADFYRKSMDEMVAELSLNWDVVTIVDSPLQNLALLRDALDGTSVLGTVGVNTDVDTLMAAFLGTAADKTMPISTDTALAVSTMLGQPLTQAEAAALAADAERIRIAILAGHG